jgi:hypothetical protein
MYPFAFVDLTPTQMLNFSLQVTSDMISIISLESDYPNIPPLIRIRIKRNRLWPFASKILQHCILLPLTIPALSCTSAPLDTYECYENSRQDKKCSTKYDSDDGGDGDVVADVTIGCYAAAVEALKEGCGGFHDYS